MFKNEPTLNQQTGNLNQQTPPVNQQPFLAGQEDFPTEPTRKYRLLVQNRALLVQLVINNPYKTTIFTN